MLLATLAAAAVLSVCLAGATTAWLALRDNDEVLQRVEALARDGRIDDGLQVARAMGGAAAAVIVAGFTQSKEASAEIAIGEAARDAEAPLRGYTVALDRIGFAGLVVAGGFGLYALSLLAWAGPDRPSTVGVSLTEALALQLCAAGLSVALVSTLGRFWLLSRIRRLTIDMEKGAAVVYNTAR